ncbi:MAG: hypothetical protein K0B01_07885 [Syntrophobacterales bacterium]|nr:hypothetical protein [Syntrophobacterales bacterium]
MTKLILAMDNMGFEQARNKGILSLLAEAREAGMIWGVKINDMLYSGDAAKIIASLNGSFLDS